MKIFKCSKCGLTISLMEWLFNPWSLCNKCEIIESKKWVKEQIKLIRKGKRKLPKIV